MVLGGKDTDWMIEIEVESVRRLYWRSKEQEPSDREKRRKVYAATEGRALASRSLEVPELAHYTALQTESEKCMQQPGRAHAFRHGIREVYAATEGCAHASRQMKRRIWQHLSA